jgi:prolyl-tRNA synthetase
VIEVGNIFKLKDKFSRAFDFTFVDREGKKRPVLMGCYGIGLPRLMGAIVEVYHDQKGIIWPKEVAPFQVHLLELDFEDPKVHRETEQIYKFLTSSKVEVLYDDRKVSPGVKFKDADLIGCPLRIVMSEKNFKKKVVEIKFRDKEKISFLKLKEFYRASSFGKLKIYVE